MDAFRAAAETIAFVPTMGHLHAGHVSLVTRARALADRAVVSVFVNPTQFNDPEDLARYPRSEAADVALLQAAGADGVFLPSVSEMYPAGSRTTVAVRDLGDRLCGAHRPGHFDGVTTVCAKLFHIVQPDVAVFGEKDWQQLQIIRRMVADLDFRIRIESAAIVREPDGLAMSSRNSRLSASERQLALCIVGALREAQRAVRAGEQSAATLNARAAAAIEAAGGRLDYVEIVSGPNLEHQTDASAADARMAIAAHFGTVRLIDNAPLHAP